MKLRFSNFSVLEQIFFRTKRSRILRFGIGTKVQNSTKLRNAGVISHYRKQKQLTLDKFFAKRKELSVAECPEPKGISTSKERTLLIELPDVIMKGDSLSKN